MKKFTYLSIVCAMSMLLFNACQKEQDLLNDTPGTVDGTNRWGSHHSNSTFYALAGNHLDEFNTHHPHAPISSATISGLQSGETILAIDFRPATGQLYGLGSTSRIYVIDPATGVSRMIGMTPFTPALSGTVAGFDFNPTVDRIRVVTSTGQNLRLNPETGATAAIDLSINGAPGAMVAAVAYQNNNAGQTTTALYDIDPASDNLYLQNPANDGTLSLVGSLNLNVEGEGGFDISPNNDALAIFNVNNVSTLFSVDLMTGGTTVMASYTGVSYTALAIPTASVAYAITTTNSLLIFGLNGGSQNNSISKPITGLAAGVTLIGLDMRPLNGQLYALANNSTVYTINSASGAATLAGTLSAPLSGSSFGFDFNPAVDRIRIVSNTGQNLRFNPNDGTTLVDVSVNPSTPQITAVAYTNNVAGTPTTALYGIDSDNKKLYQINPPNNGTLVLIGNINGNPPDANGFDVGGTSGNAYALFKLGNKARLFKINLTNGHASPNGSIGNFDINGFTIGLGF